MTVLLTKPFSGKIAGDFYTGPAEDQLVGNGQAISEPGGTFWGTESTTHVLGPRDATRDFQFMSPTAVTVRVPKEIDKLPYGIIATYTQAAAGQVTVVGDAGVTVGSTTGFPKTSGQGATMQITKTAARTVFVRGALSLT